MKTTLRKIKEKRLNDESWTKLLKSLNKTKADDEPLSILHIIKSNGIEDALWCLRAVEGHDRTIRLFAVWCARQVQQLMEDHQSLKALDVAEAFANGLATGGELKAAWVAAWDAAWDAPRAAPSDATRAATRAAASAAWAAASDASDAASSAASYAASSAASSAAWAASDAARDAARTAASSAAWAASDAARDAARTAAREYQKVKLIEMINERCKPHRQLSEHLKGKL